MKYSKLHAVLFSFLGCCHIRSAKCLELDHIDTVGAAFDFIIVGGGAAGFVVANRLTENPAVKVLVVEHGYLENNASLLIPQNENFYNFEAIQHDEDIRHLFYSFPIAPLEKLGNATYPINVASTVGGGSVINGMYLNRGSRADYDAWERLGSKGWNWDGLFPYFIKSSNFTPPERSAAEQFGFSWDESAWGVQGPVHSSLPPWEWAHQKAFRTAFTEMKDRSISFQEEANGGTNVGVVWTPNSQDPATQTRSSAKTAYYDPVSGRANLLLLTGTKVERVSFDGKKASAVQLKSRRDSEGKTISVNAKREVIIAAGPIFSPNLLHKSGVGPRKMLEEARIEVIHDLPGVGLNFQDTPTVAMKWNLSKSQEPGPQDLITNRTFYEEAKRQYDLNHTGPLIQAHGNNAAFLSLSQMTHDAANILANISEQDASSYLPSAYEATSRSGFAAQLKILLEQLGSSESAVMEFPFNGAGGNIINLLQKPLSRGTITLNISDPELGPLVNYNTLANPADRLLIEAMVNFTREFFDTPTMKTLGPEEVSPGMENSDVLAALIDKHALLPTCSHQSGACSMMPLELGGVVNDQLLVYGIERLSVVDSSIIPLLPSARLVHTVYAVAEKAADLIKARHGV
ncbi:Dehydrogenase xptC [Pseudocercospora fuligena]|uniref:Dehydrogenase xptC n=1 Tax=Pseudocercospora fuligena TaxID=685502 RepID=A0A8H6VHP7_9PEZI|nr:Dehydrogenase xptC [Pseudocercospora fuligena]